MAGIGAATRSMSLPGDLLQLLGTGNPEEDLLDFGNLEWALEHGVAGDTPGGAAGAAAPGSGTTTAASGSSLAEPSPPLAFKGVPGGGSSSAAWPIGVGDVVGAPPELVGHLSGSHTNTTTVFPATLSQPHPAQHALPARQVSSHSSGSENHHQHGGGAGDGAVGVSGSGVFSHLLVAGGPGLLGAAAAVNGGAPALASPPAPLASPHAPPVGHGSFTRLSGSHSVGGGGGNEWDDDDDDDDVEPTAGAAATTTTKAGGGGRQPPKKKRTRNEQQMVQNRIAQQKYRERKKAEHESLQQALDQLTAQLAAMKALEAQTGVLQAQNALLSSTVSEQADRITALTEQVEAQAADLAQAKATAAASAALVTSQQQMILDQHNKLRLQEEVIEQLRGRLRDKMEDAFQGHDPKTMCQRMISAVRTALAGAKNVEGFQEVLERLPEDVITDICKSILCECKKMWPELAARIHQLHTSCAQEAACAGMPCP